MKQRGSALLIILVLTALIGFVALYSFNKNSKKTTTTLSNVSPIPTNKSGYKLFNSNFVDSKYSLSFTLPAYFGSYSNWSSVSDENPDMNPDYLQIMSLGDQDAGVFRINEREGMVKEIIIHVNKGTSFEKWEGKKRTVFNSVVDGWGEDHKFVTSISVDSKSGLTIHKFTYLNSNMGQGYNENQPVTGIAIQRGSDLVIISMEHFKQNQKEVDNIFSGIVSSFKFTQ